MVDEGPWDDEFKPLLPHSYTEEEGGPWLPWPPEVDLVWSELRPAKAGESTISLGPIPAVHSIAFDDPTTRPYPRWDCLNDEIEDITE